MKDLKLSVQGVWLIVDDDYAFKLPSGATASDNIGFRQIGDRMEMAKRIAACVNACEDVPTEVLETSTSAFGALSWHQGQRKLAESTRDQMQHAAESYQLDAKEQERRAETLKAQRDELLAALEEVLRISDRKHDAWDRAHAAIAHIKGGAQ